MLMVFMKVVSGFVMGNVVVLKFFEEILSFVIVLVEVIVEFDILDSVFFLVYGFGVGSVGVFLILYF